MSVGRFHRTFTRAAAAVVGVAAIIPAGLGAQTRPEPTPLPITTLAPISEVYNFGVIDPISDRMRAQGQRLESFGRFLIAAAQARLLEEEVQRSRLQTRIERIQHFYEVRRIRWEERELGRDRILEAKKAMEDRRTEYLASINVTVPEAAGAKGLNDLLDRIVMRNLSVVETTTKPIDLPPHILRDLRIEHGTGPNKSKVLIGPEDDPFVFSPPTYFQQDDYLGPLEAYQKAREDLVRRVKSGHVVPDDELDEAFARYEDLEQVFDREFADREPGSFRSNTDPQYVRFKQGRDFLEAQIRQIGLLSVVRDMPEPFQGKTVQDLVRYMADNGYRFAKADTGGENTYYALYQQLRELHKDAN